MKKIKQLLLFAIVLLLLVGVVSASEVSEDNTDTGSITEEAVTQDTHKVSDTANNIQTSKVSNNNLNENTTKTVAKNKKNTNLKTAAAVTNWEELQSALKAAGNKDVTLILGKGNYTNTGTITWSNKKTLTIDGNGQTIDGNKQQVFYNSYGANMVLKNINIINAQSDEGGAIYNYGTLTITNSTLANNSGKDGGAIYNRGTLNIINSTLNNNKASGLGGAIRNTVTLNIINSTLINNNANNGGAIHNHGTITITNSTLISSTAYEGGAINNNGILTIKQSTLTNNTAYNGGAIKINYGLVNITQSTLTNNTSRNNGGAINNEGTLTIIESTFANNTANNGGAIRNSKRIYFNIVNSNFTGNHANKNGGAIYTDGSANLTGNKFTDNTANNRETIDLNGYSNGRFNGNTYQSTDISLKSMNLKIKNNQTLFKTGEKVVLNYTIALKNPNYYDKDILQRLDDITVYVNGVRNVTTKYEDYTLSNLERGEYMVYITTCNSESNSVTFTVIDDTMIKLTTWDVEMVQARGVTFSALVDYMNTTVNYGKVYFEIDGKALLDENASVLYAPVMDNRADLPYDMPSDISLGMHTLTAVYMVSPTISVTDTKTLTIIENIPEGAGDDGETPSEDGKQGRYSEDTRPYKTIHSSVTAGHKIITENSVIPADNVITLGELSEIFNQTFINGHLLVYVDGELVFNDTVNDDLSTVILKIIEKFLGEHEIKVEFTDVDGKKNTYNKCIVIE